MSEIASLIIAISTIITALTGAIAALVTLNSNKKINRANITLDATHKAVNSNWITLEARAIAAEQNFADAVKELKDYKEVLMQGQADKIRDLEGREHV